AQRRGQGTAAARQPHGPLVAPGQRLELHDAGYHPEQRPAVPELDQAPDAPVELPARARVIALHHRQSAEVRDRGGYPGVVAEALLQLEALLDVGARVAQVAVVEVHGAE